MNKALSTDLIGFAARAPTLIVAALGTLTMTYSTAAQNDEVNLVEAPVVEVPDRPQVVTQLMGDILLKSQEVMENGEYGRAIVVIDCHLKCDMNAFDLAKTLELRGYSEAGRDDYRQAAQDWEAYLGTGALPDYTVLDMHYRLAQVYAALEQYEWALENIETWFARVENPGAEALFLAAQLYYVADQPLDALSFAERGLVRLIEPQQNWYEVAVAIYYENGKYDKAAPLIKEMIQLWPAKGYERLRPTREIREFESDYPLDIMRACELSRN